MGFLSSIGNALNSLMGINSQMNKSFAQGIAANNLSFAQQKEAMEIQNSYNRAMWDMQNEYNTPTAQLARMRDAGVEVNPTAYALGSGNLSNTATSISSAGGFSGDFAHGSGSPAGNPISMALGVANGIAGIRNTNANTRNLYVQNANLQQQTNATKLENDIKRHNLAVARKTGMPVGETPDIWRVAGQKVSEYGRGDLNSFKQFGSDVFNLAKNLSMRPTLNPGGWLAKKIKGYFK